MTSKRFKLRKTLSVGLIFLHAIFLQNSIAMACSCVHFEEVYEKAEHVFVGRAFVSEQCNRIEVEGRLNVTLSEIGIFPPDADTLVCTRIELLQSIRGTTEKTIEFVYPAEDQGNCDATPVVGETFLFMRGGEPPYSGNMCNTFWIYNGSNVLNRLELDYGLKLDVPGYKTEK